MFLITYLSAVTAPKACGQKTKQENCTMKTEFYVVDYLVGWCVKHCSAILMVGGMGFFPSDF